MKRVKEFLPVLCRDLIAFGSIPFLVLTVIRVSMMRKPYYPMEFVIGSGLFFILMAVFRAEMRAGLGLMMLVFVSQYYHEALFAVFAGLVYCGMVFSLLYLGREGESVVKGIAAGAVSAAAGYFLARAFFPAP
jgi:hypothetical protein